MSSQYYESIEFNLSDASTDYDLDANQSEFLAVFNQDTTGGKGRFPDYCIFRTNQTVSIKLNGTGNDAITITSTDSPFTFERVEIQNMFITNASGSTAAIKIYLANSPTGWDH